MQTIPLKDIGEFGLINRIAKCAKSHGEILKGIGDDTTVIAPQEGKKILLTADMLIEGGHFTKKMGAKNIGYKALACSVSDIAAMGGWPLCAVVSLGVPGNLSVDFVQGLYKGMNALTETFHFSIAGGDTIKSNKIVINVALLGTTGHKPVYRLGAQKRDRIFVTGPLGGSLESGRHLTFTPRLHEAQYLVKNFNVSSMIDISDGLAGDLGHILEESSVGAVLYEKLIPKNQGSSLNQALYDGEDFELAFTLPSREANRFFHTKTPFPFYYIGDIVDQKEGLMVLEQNGKRRILPSKGFTHF